jgi:hypothetical protein
MSEFPLSSAESRATVARKTTDGTGRCARLDLRDDGAGHDVHADRALDLQRG